MKKTTKIIFLFLGINYSVNAQKILTPQANKTKSIDVSIKNALMQNIEKNKEYYGQCAKQIWEFAEVGYKEFKSAALLQQMLKKEGFTIENGVAGIPTAFVATFGQGYPTIGLLGEYDALPGISQDSVADRKFLDEKKAGHACGHHMFGVASAAAAIEIKTWLVENKINGTIKFFGCPAEEGGSGKVYMVREGVFNNVNVVLHWHPSNSNQVDYPTSLANKSAKFRFKGLSAHASASPENGRSALDAVEGFDMMANMMREHMPSDARMHYVITNGGKAPNVVPDFAEVYYYIRHKDKEVVIALFDRLVKIAQGAALGTETQMEYEIIGGTYDVLPNKRLSEIMNNNLILTKGYTLNENEYQFAQKIYTTLGQKAPLNKEITIQPFWNKREAAGSTDVGDVSWNVPTVGLRTATWVQGTPSHSWQAIAAGGMSIGTKGLLIATKTLALTGIDIFNNTELIKEAKKEFDTNRGANFIYKPLLGDRKPALDYRD